MPPSARHAAKKRPEFTDTAMWVCVTVWALACLASGLWLGLVVAAVLP